VKRPVTGAVLRICVVAMVASMLACNTSTRRRRLNRPTTVGGETVSLGEPLPAEAAVVAELTRQLVSTDLLITLDVDDNHTAALRARWLRLDQGAPTVAVVVVPGGGVVSLDGKRSGDGVRLYDRPVAVASEWQQALALRGAGVLTYDKRTCGPNDDPGCAKNPEQDIDAQGPLAMSKDVDAACVLVRQQVDATTPIVIVTHGQGGQVVLAVPKPLPRSLSKHPSHAASMWSWWLP
jgi:hypothetical protein